MGGTISRNLVGRSERLESNEPYSKGIKKMKFIDFFAGVGGFRRGLELAGHKCVGFCEWDKFATASYTSMHLITDKQREYLSTLDLKKRQKEILKDEYRNGEWYANDIRTVDSRSLPTADCWCFGAPCQDFSIAGKRAGLDGDRSSLIREIFRLLEEQEEQDRPEWLIYENVKGMLSSNRGLDYLSILSEMDRLGYDIEWQNINSKWFVPQNRERIYTIGHLRRFGSAKILPVEGTDGENSLYQIASVPNKTRSNPNPGRTYSIEGISPYLSTMAGGNLEPHIGLPCFIDMNHSAGIRLTDNARTLQARYCKGISNRPGEISAVAIKIIGEVNSSQDGQVHDISGIAKCHSAGHNNSPKVAIPVIDVGHIEKNQNGKRFKDNGDPMFTLTAQDRHGVMLEPIGSLYAFNSKQFGSPMMEKCINTLKSEKHDCSVVLKINQGVLDVDDMKGFYLQLPNGVICYCIWYEKEQCYITIRKLTPKECFRLQGWTDDYFEKAAFVNSDSQLYKQAGNQVTVNVVYAIGKKIAEIEKGHEDNGQEEIGSR